MHCNSSILTPLFGYANVLNVADPGFHKGVGGGGGGVKLSFASDHQVVEGIRSGVEHNLCKDTRRSYIPLL